jgi:hypothetical protein
MLMRRIRSFRAGLIAGIIGATAALPAGAGAAVPTFHDKIDVTIPGYPLCGFVGTLRVTGSQVITFTDTQTTTTGHYTDLFTTADGSAVTISAAGRSTSTSSVRSGDTVTLVDTLTGLSQMISARGSGGVEVRDAGVLTFITTINLVTGETTTDVIATGPHPLASSSTLFCDAVSAALT